MNGFSTYSISSWCIWYEVALNGMLNIVSASTNEIPYGLWSPGHARFKNWHNLWCRKYRMIHYYDMKIQVCIYIRHWFLCPSHCVSNCLQWKNISWNKKVNGILYEAVLWYDFFLPMKDGGFIGFKFLEIKLLSCAVIWGLPNSSMTWPLVYKSAL